MTMEDRSIKDDVESLLKIISELSQMGIRPSVVEVGDVLVEIPVQLISQAKQSPIDDEPAFVDTSNVKSYRQQAREELNRKMSLG